MAYKRGKKARLDAMRREDYFDHITKAAPCSMRSVTEWAEGQGEEHREAMHQLADLYLGGWISVCLDSEEVTISLPYKEKRNAQN